MNTDPVIRLSIDNGIARIVFNRPAAGNPISDAFVNAWEQVTLECADREDVRAVLISSTGPRFSVGGSIVEFAADLDKLSWEIRKWNASLNGSLARLQRMNAPTVVAVHGTIAGGALSIVAGCDIVVAADAAEFVAAYASIGYCPDLGGTISLVRRLGLARARRFHLLHERIDAAAAERIGLVDFVVPTAEVPAKAEEIAQRWAAGPTLAYGEIRRLMQSASHTPLESQLELETQSLARLVRTQDAREALLAFLEKRRPAYHGR